MRKIILMMLLAAVSSSAVAAGQNEQHCIESIDGSIKGVKLFLYNLDSNIPPLNDSKRKYLELRTADFLDWKLKEETRKAVFRELYNDPDYHIFTVKAAVTKAISAVEKLPDGQSARDFGLKFRSALVTENAKPGRFFVPQPKHLNDAFESYGTVVDAISKINDSDSALESLGKAGTLKKLKPDAGKWGYSSGAMPGVLRIIHGCYVTFLSPQ